MDRLPLGRVNVSVRLLKGTVVFTIASSTGLYFSAHTSEVGGVIAHVYPSAEAATEQVEHCDQLRDWLVLPVEDIIGWARSLSATGVSHIAETRLPNGMAVSPLADWISRQELLAAGRTFRMQNR